MRWRRALLRTSHYIGWLVLAFSIILFVFEQSGVAARLLRSLLEARLAPLGARVHVEKVDFHWLEPGIELVGFRLLDDVEVLRADHLEISLAVDLEQGLEIRSIHLDRGRLRIGPALTRSLRGLLGVPAPEEPTPSVLPRVQVRDFTVVIDTPDGEELPLGQIDIGLSAPDRGGQQRVAGRLRLPTDSADLTATSVYISGRSNPEGELRLQSSVSDLDVALWKVPEVKLLDSVRRIGPSGRISLEAKASFSVRGDIPPRGSMRLSLTDGAFTLSDSGELVRDLEFDAEVAFDAGEVVDFWSPDSVGAFAELSARWREHPLGGTLRFGRECAAGSQAEAWARVPALPLSPELRRLLGAPPWLARAWNALDPHGVADLRCGARFPREWDPFGEEPPDPELIALVQATDSLSVRWNGWQDHEGHPPVGFPLRNTVERALVLFDRNPPSARPNYLGVHYEGKHHAGGPVLLDYYTWSHPVDLPAFKGLYGIPNQDLTIRAEALPFDREVGEAMQHLGHLETVKRVYRDYGLKGGVADAEVRYATRPEEDRKATRVLVKLRDLELSPELLPVPVSATGGELEVRSVWKDGLAVRFDARGELAPETPLRIAGRIRESWDQRNTERLALWEGARLEVDDLDLQGPTRTVIDEHLPGIGAALAEFNPSGHVDLVTLHSTLPGEEPTSTCFQIETKNEPTLRPPAVPVLAREVRGRTIVRAGFPLDSSLPETPVETRVSPIVGTWPDGSVVTLMADFPSGEASDLRIAGAGLRASGDAKAEDVLPTLLAASREGSDASSSSAVASQVEVLGRVDFEARLRLQEGDGEDTQLYSILLRNNGLQVTPELRFEQLAGRLTYEGDQLHSRELATTLAGTPIRFTDFHASLDGSSWGVHSTVEADDLPLDAEHLSILLDEETLKALIEDLEWRGELDIKRAGIALEGSGEGPPRIELSGDLTLSDMQIQLGLPILISSGSVHVDELIVEDGRVRGYGRVDDLYGQLAGMELSQANLLLTYFDRFLSIEKLGGEFEGGRIESLDAHSKASPAFHRPGPVLSVNLVAPYAFQLAVALADVDVKGIVSEIFRSDETSRGRLDAGLRVTGELQDLLSIEGRGYGRLRETRLWSVPVFRELFGQLGFDDTAVFDSMETRLALADGKIVMSDVEVHSPLLRLAGNGVLNLNGDLKFDMEIRYGLVPRLPLITRLFYFVQNTLLSVSIRGTMGRPVVLLSGSLSGALLGKGGGERRLPLPGLHPLPSRF